MEGDQVAAYAEAGRIDGIMSASYLFNSARISSVIAGSKHVLDLGCGPATQLAQIAQLNPEIAFTGVDLSLEMLSDAQSHISAMSLTNVELTQCDITDLSVYEDNSFDSVISTMAIHHLPTLQDLNNCFLEIKRVLKPGGGLYLTDFSRMKSLRSVLFFAYMNRLHQPHLFSLDYERSLRAAFHSSDFSTLANKYFPADTQHRCTFGIPVLQLIKSADRGLTPPCKAQIQAMRQQLPSKYRRELDDQRFFFWLSGLRSDPFS